jgi:alkylation response protein AidB-like acyl-CoA dehydrogenase
MDCVPETSLQMKTMLPEILREMRRLARNPDDEMEAIPASGSIERSEMNLITPEQTDIQQAAKAFVAKHIIPKAAEYDKSGAFHDVKIPGSALLGQEGDSMKIAIETLDLARPAIGALAVGLAQEGTNQVQRLVVARAVLARPKVAAHADMAMPK